MPDDPTLAPTPAPREAPEVATLPPYAPPGAPFQSLAYPAPRRAPRPRLLTAVGVASIVVASFGGLLGAVLTVQGFGLFLMSMAFSRAASAGAAAAAATTAPSPSPAAAPATPAAPSAPAAPSSTQPPVETETGGPKEIHRHEVLVGSRAPSTAPAATAPATTAPAGPLTPAEIQSVIQQAQAQAAVNGGAPLNPAQVAALQTLLSGPAQTLVPPGTSQGAVTVSYVDPKGTATLDFAGGTTLVLAPGGQVVSQVTIPTFPNLSINPWAVPLFLASTVLSVALAIFLLVAGIFVLRESRRGRRLHLIYAALKLPLALGLGAAVVFVASEIIRALRAASPTPGGFPMRVAFIAGGVAAAVGCVYPIVLLIALNTRRVREYYHSVETT